MCLKTLSSWGLIRLSVSAQRLSLRGRQVQLAVFNWPMVLLLTAMVAAVACLPGTCDQFEQIPARKTLIGNMGTVRSIAFRHDGAMLSSVGADCLMAILNLKGAIKIDANTTSLARSDSLPLAQTTEFWCCPARRRRYSFTISWTTSLGRSTTTLPSTARAACLAFSPDGTSLAVGQEDGKISLWDAQSRQKRLTLAAHEGFVAALAFAPDGFHAGFLGR